MLPPVYVLIGGKSSRFGAEKAAFPVDGQPWAPHVGERLSGQQSYTLVGNASAEGVLLGVPRIEDAPDCVGPLAGVVAALEDRRKRLGEGLLVLASCDLVRPEPWWLIPLLSAHHDDAGLEIAAYKTHGLWQPFPSVVHTRWRPNAAYGNSSLQAAFGAAQSCAACWPGGGAGPPQANTRGELERLLLMRD